MKLKANIPDLEMNFLNWINVSSMYVKKQSLDQVPFTEAFIMHLIATKNNVNLPYFIIHQMVDVPKHFKPILPNSIVLTRVFRYFEVDLSDEVIETPKETHVYYIEACV